MTETHGQQRTHTTTEDGAAIVLVPLIGHGRPAIALRADIDEMLARGLSMEWEWVPSNKGNGKGYVRMKAEGVYACGVSVARVIARGGRKNIPKHIDGDPLNLRRGNLRLEYAAFATSDLPSHLRLSGYRVWGEETAWWERSGTLAALGTQRGGETPSATPCPAAVARPRLPFPGETRQHSDERH